MKYKLLAASILATLSTTATSATYQLSELGTLEDAKYSYVTDVSESGHIIGFANGLYNLPIDISYIDFTENIIENNYDNTEAAFELSDKEITFTLDDIENNDAVLTNADAHTFMVSFLSSISTNFEYQKLSSLVGIKYNDTQVTEQPLFDVESVDYDGLTRSTTNLFNAVSEDGVTVGWGSAPYDKVSFTPDGDDEAETWFTHEFIERGIVISADGMIKVPLEPEFNEYGGTSRANDIVKTNSGYTVVGNMSTSIPDDRQDNIDDNCDNEGEPASVCINLLNTNISRGLFNKRAVKWELDESLNVISVKELGLALTPDEGETEDDAFTSTALAVNSNGIIVGSSNTRYYKNDDTILTMPVYFKDGAVTDFIDQEDDWQAGKSIAINDNDVITGYATKRIEGTLRNKLFYHDIATGNTVFPTDYFSSSSSYGNDINNQGYIVGEGEVGVSDNTRRKEAFIYKIGEDKITNLNDLLPCFDTDGETNYAYTMAEATSINENNEIFGTATKTVEKLDSLGGVVTDVNGEIEYESIAVAVKLTPIANGEVENCAPPEAEVYERNSASFPWYTLLLLPLVGLRRIFRF
ncbi:MAG TPA: DUF3466 family protein [Pseudoalteromonas sp.]|uniref:DUF3466 family protein n=1 Tax=marine sediment metagenome TaxID=412755 RepID=A0A0F9VW03_9ZZZZ|nr:MULTISPECIES: DUF3466 family protein [unclassified Pseudoalteromonas]MBA6408651.1 DUF3466 family protein [Pseudoalteromonas sp. 5Ae-yellow]MDN3389891.1 DUF3466 family protein [Pseudoalteromonas sp. APC 3691]HDY91165.1 DUF3466 family protein [Pseudoalteromonas sp.]HDZ32420.1 DUF3466 family protein [Pseudoalteromonas sp.]